jgi:hypothetical protein
MTERLPLVSDPYKGWVDVADPQPGVQYSAYREVCPELYCPFMWPPSVHSHIIEMPITWPNG